jgi:hypothetical protein
VLTRTAQTAMTGLFSGIFERYLSIGMVCNEEANKHTQGSQSSHRIAIAREMWTKAGQLALQKIGQMGSWTIDKLELHAIFANFP